MAASSSPTLRVGNSDIKPSTSPGRKPSTGMLCRMSSSGSRSRSAAGDFAAAQPNPSAKRYEIKSARTPRDSEYNVYQGSAAGLRSMRTACENGASNSRANETTTAITPPSRQRIAVVVSFGEPESGGGQAQRLHPRELFKLRPDARDDDGNDGRAERRAPLHATRGAWPARGGAARRPRRTPRLRPPAARPPRRGRPRAPLLRPARRRSVTGPARHPGGLAGARGRPRGPARALGARPPHGDRLLVGGIARPAVRARASRPDRPTGARLLGARDGRVARRIRAPLRGPHGPAVDRAQPRRPRSVRPLPDRSRKVSPHRVRAIRRRLFSRPEPREGNDPVSRHRAHSAGGVGESGDLRPPPADPADLPERDGSPRPVAARHLRPDAPRGGAGDCGTALDGCDRAGHRACAARGGDGGLRAGAGRVPAAALI